MLLISHILSVSCEARVSQGLQKRRHDSCVHVFMKPILPCDQRTLIGDGILEHGVTTTEQALIEQWRRGDAAAFAAIIERHQRVIFGYLRARLSQTSDAEDMTQEVFLRFHLAQARFDSQSMVRPWLLGIARNLLREHVRSVRRRKEVGWTELCLELESLVPFESQATEDALNHLPVCLENLGPSARQAIELKYRSDQRLSEIGRQMHRSEGAVKLLVHRARQALRDCLDHKSKSASRT